MPAAWHSKSRKPTASIAKPHPPPPDLRRPPSVLERADRRNAFAKRRVAVSGVQVCASGSHQRRRLGPRTPPRGCSARELRVPKIEEVARAAGGGSVAWGDHARACAPMRAGRRCATPVTIGALKLQRFGARGRRDPRRLDPRRLDPRRRRNLPALPRGGDRSSGWRCPGAGRIAACRHPRAPRWRE